MTGGAIPDTLRVMKRRYRLFAALLALFAFSASFTESVWAATCAPMGAQMAYDSPATAAQHPALHGGGATAEIPEDDSDKPACPLPALAATGCVSVLLPPIVDIFDVPVALVTESTLSPAHADGRLVAVSLFRPPRP